MLAVRCQDGSLRSGVSPLLKPTGGLSRLRVPLFGEFGLVSQLGSSDYSRPRKFREKLEGWLKLVRAMWPECPAHIDEDGIALVVDRSVAVRQTITTE